jgi:hypothetical protein
MLKEVIVDSALSAPMILAQNPNLPCPEDILNRQAILTVLYWSFDSKFHQGQLVIDRRLAEDVMKVFAAAAEAKFPISSMIPAADPRFTWDDEIMMGNNNTSGFNYRLIGGQAKPSLHSLGQAVDINPKLNPQIRNGVVSPAGATRNLSQPGTITGDCVIVKTFDSLGWEWGGRWTSLKDWQHFQKPLD